LTVLSSPTYTSTASLANSPELSYLGPLEETPNIQHTAEQGVEAKPHTHNDLANLLSDLRSAFGSNYWFRVVPLTPEESRMIQQNKKQPDIELMSGKVLIGQVDDEILGVVKIWATVRKVRVVGTGGLTRTQWRIRLFNDRDYAEVSIPRSPDHDINNVKLATVFAFLWAPDLSTWQWTGRVGDCVRVALADAGYQGGGKVRIRSIRKTLDAIKDNVKFHNEKMQKAQGSKTVSGGSARSQMASGLHESTGTSSPADYAGAKDTEPTQRTTLQSTTTSATSLGKRANRSASMDTTPVAGAKKLRVEPFTELSVARPLDQVSVTDAAAPCFQATIHNHQLLPMGIAFSGADASRAIRSRPLTSQSVLRQPHKANSSMTAAWPHPAIPMAAPLSLPSTVRNAGVRLPPYLGRLINDRPDQAKNAATFPPPAHQTGDEDLLGNIRDLEQTNVSLVSRMKDQDEQTQKHAKEHGDLHHKYHELEATKDDLEVRAGQLGNELRAKSEQEQASAAKFRDLEVTNGSLEVRVEQQGSELRVKTEQEKEWVAKIRSLEAAKADLEVRVAQQDDELRVKAKQEEDFDVKFGTQEGDNAELWAENQLQAQEIADLTAQVTQQTTQLAANTKTIELLEGKNSRLKERNVDLQDKNEELLINGDYLDERIHYLDQRVEQLEDIKTAHVKHCEAILLRGMTRTRVHKGMEKGKAKKEAVEEYEGVFGLKVRGG
jgi:hypothetical protein